MAGTDSGNAGMASMAGIAGNAMGIPAESNPAQGNPAAGTVPARKLPGSGQTVAVVGGGIGGLCAALLLQRNGYAVTVYDQAAELKEIGAGICVFPNGMRVLHHLGLGAALEAQSVPFTGFGLWSQGGKVMQSVQFPRHEVAGISIHRGLLHSTLLKAFSGTVVPGHRCTGLRRVGGRVLPEFANGSVADADIVIGADGYNSALRQTLIAGSVPQYQHYVEWRGVADLDCSAEVGRDLIELQGRGLRFGIFAIGGGKTAWWITSNEPQQLDLPASRFQAHLLQKMAGFAPLVGKLLAATPANAMMRTPLFDLDPQETWFDGNLCLLGDAIHPATPNLGQGASMAIEDAAALVNALAKHPDRATAFAAYRQERQQRCAQVQKVARTLGKMGQWSNPLAVWLRELSIKLTPGTVLFATTIKLQEFKPSLDAC